MRVLDAHLHLWDPSLRAYPWLTGELDRPFGPEDLAAAGLTGADRGAVFVEADAAADSALDEVTWAASIAPRVGIRAIVGAAPLEHPERTLALLEAYAREPLVRGVRRILHAEPDGFALARGFVDSARAVAERGLTFDACVRSAQLRDIAGLADAVPSLTIVLDHLGKPPIAEGSAERDAWERDLGALAEHPRVVVKLSGLPAEAGPGWTRALVDPLLDVGLAAFGPERLVFGSDWPVSAGSPSEAQRWQRAVADWARERLGEEAADAVLWRNGAAAYGIAAR